MKKPLSKKAKGVIALGLVACVLLAGFGLWQLGKKAVDFYYDTMYPLAYEDLILQNAKAQSLPPAFVAAVINAESSYNPHAVSSQKAYGLMQIQKDTFDWAKAKSGETRDLKAEDLFTPEINVQYGCIIYRLLLNEFGSLEVAVAAYHAGWGTVKGWLANPQVSPDGKSLSYIPYEDTKLYWQRVQKGMQVYEKRYPRLSEADL